MSKKLNGNAKKRWAPAKGRAHPSKTYTYQARNGLWYAEYLTSPDAREDYKNKKFKALVKYPASWGKLGI
jgi:hypothetical protein